MSKLVQPKTWFLIQWFSTILFIVHIVLNVGKTFMVIGNIPIPITLFTIITFIGMCISQAYVYGYYFKNSQETVLYPFIAVLLCGFCDILFSFLLGRLDIFIPYILNLFKFYLTATVCTAINILVYNKVEFLELPVDELYKIENGTYETKTVKEKQLQDKYI